MDHNKNALEFVSQNGDELIRPIFFSIHNDILNAADYFWSVLKDSRLFQDKDQAILALLLTFISIRTEIEMQSIYHKYGDAVYREMGQAVKSYYNTFLANFVEDEKDTALFLMHNAHETLLNHEKKGYDTLLALQFQKVAATTEAFSPSLFEPLVPLLSEGGTMAEVIERNIECKP